MKHVELNFESKNILTDQEARIIFLHLYNASIATIYRKYSPSADNKTLYIVDYDTAQSLNDIIQDIKYLCFTMGQNCIATIIKSDSLDIQAIISKDVIDKQYRPFNPKYFTTCVMAENDENSTCIYRR